MSGAAFNEDGETISLACCFELTPPLRHDGRNSIYAAVTNTGIWECDWTGHITGFGHILGKRHGTPDQDMLAIGYAVER